MLTQDPIRFRRTRPDAPDPRRYALAFPPVALSSFTPAGGIVGQTFIEVPHEEVERDRKEHEKELERMRKKAGLPPLPKEGERGPNVEEALLAAVNNARKRANLPRLTELPPEARAALQLPAPPKALAGSQVLDSINVLRKQLGLRELAEDELPKKLRSEDYENLLEQALSLSMLRTSLRPAKSALVADAERRAARTAPQPAQTVSLAHDPVSPNPLLADAERRARQSKGTRQ